MSEIIKETMTGNEAVFTERKRLLFFGLPWTFTKYTITPTMLTVDEGLLKTTENDCYMYKIQDVRLSQSLLEKIFGLGTVECFSGDVTHPDMCLLHVKNAKEIKNYILEASEEARMKRRTINTVDIGADDI
ncbi:MAG: PH domain-containing protein [Lachnospiraceae bacterium]|nr:PH domain-containing protein [Lachnospiraceae bacterium]